MHGILPNDNSNVFSYLLIDLIIHDCNDNLAMCKVILVICCYPYIKHEFKAYSSKYTSIGFV